MLSLYELDHLKRQYVQQQIAFDKELEQLRYQLSRADTTRLQAEKELMLLQEKAKESRIWNILNQQAYFPTVIQGERLFRTAKYAIGNMSESDKRQQLLLDYYQRLNSTEPLYQEPKQMQQSQLYAETKMILKPQKPKFDETLLNDLKSMKNKNQEVTKRLPNDESEIIKDRTEFEKMLQNQSMVQLMQDLRNQGQRPAFTPPENKSPLEYELEKKMFSEGRSVQVTFLDAENGEQDQEVEDNAVLLNESEIPKITEEQPFEYEEEEEVEEEEVEDKLDQDINKLLDNIQNLIQDKKQKQDYNQVRQKLRIATQNDYILVEQKRPEHFMDIQFAENAPLYVEKKEPIQVRVVDEDTYEMNRLDRLIKELAD